eukprot:4223661-Pleurochrysis_carterae.AAC.1
MLLGKDGLSNIGQEECDWTSAKLHLDEMCATHSPHYLSAACTLSRCVIALFCDLTGTRFVGVFSPSSAWTTARGARFHETYRSIGNNFPQHSDETVQNEIVVSVEDGDFKLRDAFIEHFHVQRINKRVLWPKMAIACRQARVERDQHELQADE